MTRSIRKRCQPRTSPRRQLQLESPVPSSSRVTQLEEQIHRLQQDMERLRQSHLYELKWAQLEAHQRLLQQEQVHAKKIRRKTRRICSRPWRRRRN